MMPSAGRKQELTAPVCGLSGGERAMRPKFAFPVAAIAYLLGPGPAAAQTATELLQSCEAITNTARSTQANTIDIPRAGVPCWYYMSAIQNASVLVDGGGNRLLGICAPADATLMDHVRIFVQYARRNQKDSPDNAAALAVIALSQAYPCSGN
jgi:Rap1a immunity proteins